MLTGSSRKPSPIKTALPMRWASWPPTNGQLSEHIDVGVNAGYVFSISDAIEGGSLGALLLYRLD